MDIPRQGRLFRPIQMSRPGRIIYSRFRIDPAISYLDQRPFFHQSTDRTFRIVQVAKDPGFGGTRGHTGRFFPSMQPVFTIIAFFPQLGIGIPKSCSIGTTRHTISAPDAFFWINDHHPVGSFIGSPDRAGGNTGRFGTLHALSRLELGPPAFKPLGQFNPVPPIPFRHIIFHFTGYLTCFAVKAFPGVDNQDEIFSTEVYHEIFLTVTKVSCIAMLPEILSFLSSRTSTILAPFP